MCGYKIFAVIIPFYTQIEDEWVKVGEWVRILRREELSAFPERKIIAWGDSVAEVFPRMSLYRPEAELYEALELFLS